MITQERLKSLMFYNEGSGWFWWKCNAVRAGSTRKDGYVVIRIDGKLYLAHRLAWFYVHGRWPEPTCDHIDRNPSNNQLANLRELSHSHNHLNANSRINNTSGYNGVGYHKATRKWRVRVNRKHIGLFETIDEAIIAYDQAFSQLYKELA